MWAVGRSGGLGGGPRAPHGTLILGDSGRGQNAGPRLFDPSRKPLHSPGAVERHPTDDEELLRLRSRLVSDAEVSAQWSES